MGELHSLIAVCYLLEYQVQERRMEAEQNFSMMTLAKYWPDLTPEERESALTQSQLPLELDNTCLAQTGFKAVARRLQDAGVKPEDERLYTLAILVSEQGAKRNPRCPGCGRALIVIPGEATYCPLCDCS